MALPKSTTVESRDLRAIAGAIPVEWMRKRVFEIASVIESVSAVTQFQELGEWE